MKRLPALPSRRITTTLLALCAPFEMARAQAQNAQPPSRPASAAAPPTATSASEPAQRLEAVTVTGRREPTDRIVIRRSTGGALFGESDLREVPFSVNIVGEAEIKNRQAGTVSEMLATDPSIGSEYVDSGGAFYERLRIRGFTQGYLVINGQLTGLDAGFFTSATVDRIEVLRGPAAFRYGFVAPGGVINIVTKRPTTQARATGSVLLTGEGEAGTQVDLSSHFDAAKRFGYRLNALASSGDTAIDTTRRRRGVFAFATDFKFSNDLTIYADVELAKIRSRGGASLFPNIGVASDGTLPAALEPSRTIQPDWNTLEGTNRLAGLEVNWSFAPNWRLNSLFRHVDTADKGWGGVLFYAPFEPDGDHVLANYGYENQYRTVSNTTFAQGTFETSGIGHKLTVGGSYLNAKLDGYFAENNDTARVASNLDAPATLPYSDPGRYLPGFDIREKQSGAFVSDELSIGRWRPLAGLRYSRFDYGSTFSGAPTSTSKVSPMLALSYEASDALTLYGSYATGLENGGRAPVGTNNANAPMPPLLTKGYELGAKTDLLGGVATLDVALFSAHRSSAFTDATGFYVQSGKQVHDGVEIVAKGRYWQPLEISAGVTYIDAKLKGDPALDGNRAVNVPRWRGVFYGEYAIAAVPGLYASGRIDAVGKKDYNLPNRNQVAGYTLFGLGLRYETLVDGHKAALRLNVDNLSDKAYWAKADTFDGLIGAPRTVKASVELGF